MHGNSYFFAYQNQKFGKKNIKMSQFNDIVNKQLILYYYMQSIEIMLFPS